MPATQEPAPEPHLLVEGLEKRFGSFVALSGIDMRVDRGEVAVIIGGSGAGKTTLLKILIGLDEPSSGRIVVGGVDVAAMRGRERERMRRKFGMVFQYSALLDSLSVFDNVAFPLREHTRLSEKQIRDKVLETLAILELQGTERRFPSQLSGGMRKRVGLARALMLDPEVLMYDEPTSGLDPLSSRLVDDLILQTRARYGVTSLVISHDMAGALQIADRIFMLQKGRLVVQGTPEELVGLEGTLANEFFAASGISAGALVRARHGAR